MQAIDKDSDGALTLEEFIDAYNRRTEILKRQVGCGPLLRSGLWVLCGKYIVTAISVTLHRMQWSKGRSNSA